VSKHVFLGKHKEDTAATKWRDRWGCLFIFLKTADVCMSVHRTAQVSQDAWINRKLHFSEQDLRCTWLDVISVTNTIVVFILLGKFQM